MIHYVMIIVILFGVFYAGRLYERARVKRANGPPKEEEKGANIF
jgi:hypothetical protein